MGEVKYKLKCKISNDCLLIPMFMLFSSASSHMGSFCVSSIVITQDYILIILRDFVDFNLLELNAWKKVFL